jgi:hypothetical protein
MKKKIIIIFSALLLLIFLIGIKRVTLRVEGELYLSCEDTTVTFPFKHSVSTRMFGIPNAKKAGEIKAETLMDSLENMFEGAEAEYEIKNVTLTK